MGFFISEVFILYNYIFIGNILDFCINHIFSKSFYTILKSLLVIQLNYIVVNLFIISLFFALANYYDLKFGIIPNKLSLSLIIYGLSFLFFISLSFLNPYFLLFSIALTSLVAFISFILWYIGFWGGGDFKFFIGLSLALSFFDLNDAYVISTLNFPIFYQFIFYPAVFSVLLNAILIAFIFILLYMIYSILKNKQLAYYSILSVIDFKSMFKDLTTNSISINDLCGGMIIDKYYFNNPDVFDIINSVNAEKESYSNLKAYKEEDTYYFTSLNRIGLTEYDIELINDFYTKGLIKNHYFKIKKGIPFMPFLTLGYVAFLAFGDFISIISSFIKILF